MIARNSESRKLADQSDGSLMGGFCQVPETTGALDQAWIANPSLPPEPRSGGVCFEFRGFSHVTC